MRSMRVIAAILSVITLLASGCGWSPAGPEHAGPVTCADADGPSADTVARSIAGVAPLSEGAQWTETGRGNTRDCRLYWVQIDSTDATASTPGQVLFFDHNTYLGTPTPNPKPYITVLETGQDTITIQYQWLQGNEPNCCPTGIGSVRFAIGDDGRLQALDPIPNQ